MITVVTTINHQWRFIPAVEDVDRNSYGTIAYGITITTLLLRSGQPEPMRCPQGFW